MIQVGGDGFYGPEDNLYGSVGNRDTSNLVAASSPAVRLAWQTAVRMVEAGITARLQVLSPGWLDSFRDDSFAVTFCPSWTLDTIESRSGPSRRGEWDIAAVPGGGGNWGGSWLAVPIQSRFPAEAAKLAEFLTSASSQVAACLKSGTAPTSKRAIGDSQLRNVIDPYFNNAPRGRIFAESVAALEPFTLGPKYVDIKERAFERALHSYETDALTAPDAWAQFLRDVQIFGRY